MTLYTETAGPGATQFDEISFLGASRVVFRNLSPVALTFAWNGLPAGLTAAPEGRSIIVGPPGSGYDIVVYDGNGARVPDGGSLSVYSTVGAAQFSVDVT
jgi:hypothetical protein